jgi:hypothetical protein
MQAASDFLESDFLESGDTDIWVISVPPTTTIHALQSVFPRLAPASRDCRGFLFVQKLRQLGNVRRDPPRFIFCE